MTEIGLNHQHTIQDVEMCNDKNCMYGKILLQSIYGQKPKKFRIVISGKELVEYAEKKSQRSITLNAPGSLKNCI